MLYHYVIDTGKRKERCDESHRTVCVPSNHTSSLSPPLLLAKLMFKISYMYLFREVISFFFSFSLEQKLQKFSLFFSQFLHIFQSSWAPWLTFTSSEVCPIQNWPLYYFLHTEHNYHGDLCGWHSETLRSSRGACWQIIIVLTFPTRLTTWSKESNCESESRLTWRLHQREGGENGISVVICWTKPLG